MLRELLKRFEPEWHYAEREVNDILGRAHEDMATLRRELVMYGFMNRERGEYWLAASESERGRNVAQEIA